MPSFQIGSDFHIEFQRDGGHGFLRDWKRAANNIILAGDINIFANISKTLNEISEMYDSVVYVPGNHEYYGHDCREINWNIPELYSNVHILINKSVVIEGVKISGTTLWFPEDPGDWKYEDLMSDFHVINNFKPWVYIENQKARGFIKNNYDSDIIVTHHMPSHALVDSHFKGYPLNRFFVDPMLDNQYDWECRAKYWIFGHTHSSNFVKLGDTLCVSNPFGYPTEGNWSNFNPSLVITL